MVCVDEKGESVWWFCCGMYQGGLSGLAIASPGFAIDRLLYQVLLVWPD